MIKTEKSYPERRLRGVLEELSCGCYRQASPLSCVAPPQPLSHAPRPPAGEHGTAGQDPAGTGE
ncbi:unnamed protein product, partial [Gulo gulo]